MKARAITYFLSCSLLFSACIIAQKPAGGVDAVAENMLLYQRYIGGWPKHVNDVKIDYNKSLSPSEKEKIISDKRRKDATIDNHATSKEIRYLLTAYKNTGNKNYVTAAEQGIAYLLLMQMPNGGFPQYYPDSSSYRGQITYNDNAMINALNVLWDVAHDKSGFTVVNASLKEGAKKAIEKGIDCIVKTQIIINGKRTGWCAQHDKRTGLPVKARAFEPASISSMETVGIVDFLMKIDDPSPQIKDAIISAVQWLAAVQIRGFKYEDIDDKTQPGGKDRVLVKEEGASVWARFYNLENGLPVFAGRDGVTKVNLQDIDVERRTGYAWYGTWPQKLISKTYPAWRAKNGLLSTKTHIIVSKDGKGDYISIQAAIDDLPDTSATPRNIFIKAGTYNEKIFITKHNIILQGEDRESTIIVQSVARDEWRCQHADDWGVATLNLDGDDITLLNLSVINDYGFLFKEPRTIICASDSSGKKIITANGHQMALRSINSTRLKAVNCRFKAWAGDTVSPWNLSDGMFYFKDCIMEGGVDFYCPRGWAYAENCSFFANTGSAALWHDGSGNADFKTVLKDCRFDGYKGFRLGRYHRDAQFFIINSSFSQNMADADIYQVPTTNVLQWGRRVYFANSHREGGDYVWHKDNLKDAPGAPSSTEINADWVFKGKWKPEQHTK